jgi:hypothetical protein
MGLNPLVWWLVVTIILPVLLLLCVGLLIWWVTRSYLKRRGAHERSAVIEAYEARRRGFGPDDKNGG